MSLVSKFIFGTVDFAFGEVLPALAGFLTGRATKAFIKSGSLKKTEGSNFAVRRSLSRRSPFGKNLPLWKRAIHVPDEGRMFVLKDSGVQRDVEYTIQEHLAEKAGRHYDLRLHLSDEKGRVRAISWAIPMKGKRAHETGLPKPGEKWAAIRVSDHEPAYSKFSGTIPKGEHGAGTVSIWASGKADIYKIEDGHVHFAIHEGVAKGHYIIVNTGGKNGTQGLILSKKPEVVDVWTKPSYTRKDETLLEDLEASGRYVAERKVDGASVELRVGERQMRTYSHRISKKSGVLIEHTDRLPHLDGANMGGLEGTALRAEAYHSRGVNHLAGTLNSNIERAREVQRRTGPIQFDVFDITKYKGKDVTGLPYSERRALYTQVVSELGSPHIHPIRQVKSHFGSFYDQQVRLKTAPTDGIVLKAQDQAYPGTDRDGSTGSIRETETLTKAPPWIKVKPSELADCEILAVTRGADRLSSGMAGALTVQTPEGSRVQVGSGFSDWERRWIWNHRADLVGETARVEFHVRNGDRTNTGPRFDSFHPDKSEAALKMYSEALSDDPKTIYRLKSAAGWRAA